MTMTTREAVPSVISVIIPTWNSSPQIGQLLQSLRNQTFEGLEIIVVDRNSEDETAEVSRRLGATVLMQESGRSEARNFGASKSTGNYLLFLDSDMQLAPDALSKCSLAIATYDALCLKEKSVTGRNYWARARAIERDSFFHTLYYESARFFRKDIFEAIGGYDTTMVGFEDLDLQARLLEKGFRIGWSDALVLHHEEDIGFFNYLKKRNLYTTTAKTYADRHRHYWKELNSVARRYRLILGAIENSRGYGSLLLLPGLLIMRMLEYTVAKVRTLGLIT